MNISSTESTLSTATRLMTEALVWDNHVCMPLRREDEEFLPKLIEAKAAGYNVVSINIGMDILPWQNAIQMLATFRRWIKCHADQYRLVESISDIEAAKLNNQLAICFDLEGGVALDSHLPMVQLYYDLGVRWMLLAYNRNNVLAGGCHDNNKGLTKLGQGVVREMERVGMIVCCSHTSHQAAMEIMEMAKNPVIFSHSNPKALRDHYRNINDEAIKACAATAGVIGITGVGIFLGENDTSPSLIAQHIDYVVQMVGVEHVGFSTDYAFDKQEMLDWIKNNPTTFDPKTFSGELAITTPAQLVEIAEALLRLNYSEANIKLILGGNFHRVAQLVWK